ncbi:hypothetical protein F2P79_000963 [Pimephales promelas]|nr:hypothetical protein F2P79_000963 [Pimephales promelas]
MLTSNIFPVLTGTIFTEDDLTGKRASIAYEDCLKQLASFLTLPVQRCPYRCDVSQRGANAAPPSTSPSRAGVQRASWSGPVPTAILCGGGARSRQ